MDLKFKELSLVNRIEILISFIIKISLIIAVIQEVFLQRWLLLFLTGLALILTFLPAFIRKNYKIILPVEFELIITLFIYSSIILGDIKGFYVRFFWWDLFLHAVSGIILGFIGFFIIYVLYSQEKVKMRPVFVALFSFCFAVSIGTIWEIFEFLMDSLFKMNMQKSGLIDTMWDLIIDSMGAAIVSISGFFYVNGGDSFIFNRWITKFVEKNKHLMGKV